MKPYFGYIHGKIVMLVTVLPSTFLIVLLFYYYYFFLCVCWVGGSYSAFLVLLLRFITISFRRLKGPGVPAAVLRCATGSCDIYIVSRDKTVKNPADSASTSGKLQVHAAISGKSCL